MTSAMLCVGSPAVSAGAIGAGRRRRGDDGLAPGGEGRRRHVGLGFDAFDRVVDGQDRFGIGRGRLRRGRLRRGRLGRGRLRRGRLRRGRLRRRRLRLQAAPAQAAPAQSASARSRLRRRSASAQSASRRRSGSRPPALRSRRPRSWARRASGVRPRGQERPLRGTRALAPRGHTRNENLQPSTEPDGRVPRLGLPVNG